MRSTNTKEAEDQVSSNQAYKPMRSKKSVETQVQTDILTRPMAQTDAYDILLCKANDERIKMNRQEKRTQAEAMDFHAEVQQPTDQRNHYTTVSHHQQTSQTMTDNPGYSGSRDQRPDRNRINTGQDYYNTGNRFDHYDRNRQ